MHVTDHTQLHFSLSCVSAVFWSLAGAGDSVIMKLPSPSPKLLFGLLNDPLILHNGVQCGESRELRLYDAGTGF